MVQSRIDKAITYPDIKTIDRDDFGHDAVQFEIELMPDIEAMIALGKVRYTYVDDDILYIPVYLVYKGSVISQIGIYEFPAANYVNLFDADGDFDITKLKNPIPLFYSFVTEAYLKTTLKTPEKESSPEGEDTPDGDGDDDDDGEEESGDDDDDDDGEEGDDLSFKDTLLKGDEWSSPNKPTLLEQIKMEEDVGTTPGSKTQSSLMDDDMEERKKYVKKHGHNWIQTYMKNTHYGIIDNEGAGHCLFAVIRDAYIGIPKEVTVAQLRQIVSNHATERTFKDFREQYDMYANVIQENPVEMEKNTKQLKAVRAVFKKEKARDRRVDLVKEAKTLLKKREEIKQDKDNARVLIRDFRFMKNITSLKKFKKVIKTCNFWANTWTIALLEKILNIKLIILSRANYRAEDIDNVLQCGNAIDEEIVAKGTFKPKYYIIFEFRMQPVGHYTLVTYKGRRIFRFKEIPFGIKQLIVDKCMESDEGIYHLIPKFKQLKEQLYPPEEEEEKEEDDEEDDDEDDDEDNEGDAEEKEEEGVTTPKTDSGAEDMGMPEEEPFDEGFAERKDVGFDKNTVFQFYSKSANAYPGMGSGEKIRTKNKLNYATLNAIPNWRKTLSNFSTDEFDLDGHRWKSVEHFYQGSKFKKGNPEFYETFSLDSGSALSKNPSLAKTAGGKTGKSKGTVLRPATIKIDEDFFTDGRNERVMYRAQMAKYKQNETAKKVLLNTRDAKLQHFVRASKPIVFYDTMKIREILK